MNNGSKKTLGIAAFVLTVGLIIFGWGVAFSNVKDTADLANVNANDAKEQSHKNEVTIGEIKTDIKWIREGVQEIKEAVK